MKKNLYTNGKEYLTARFEPYSGYYHVLDSGEAMTERIPKPSSEKLLDINQWSTMTNYNDATGLKPKTPKTPANFFPNPKQSDYETGHITRAFIVKLNDLSFCTEVNPENVGKIMKDQPDYIQLIELRWFITGPADTIGFQTGVKQQNELEISNYRKFSGLQSKLKNLQQFRKLTP